MQASRGVHRIRACVAANWGCPPSITNRFVRLLRCGGHTGAIGGDAVLTHEAVGFFLETCETITGHYNVDVLKGEAVLILELMRHDSLTIKEAMILTRYSYRGFYLVVDRLIDKNIIKIEADSEDRRVKRIMLRTDRVTVDEGSVPLIDSATARKRLPMVRSAANA
jgi:hypothetical protein